MSSGPGLLGLDRKAMEEERLARLARKRGAEEFSTLSNTQRQTRRPISPPAKRTKVVESAETNQPMKVAVPKVESTEIDEPVEVLPPKVASVLQYPHGAIKKTWAYKYERKNDIKIEEVLQRSTLRTAVLSTYTLDFDWIATKLDLSKTKLMLVLHERDKEKRAEWKSDAAKVSSTLRLCFPPLFGPFDCMHSKLMLLFYSDHLRVVVPSANLVPFDWGETGVMENSVFLIDLPRRDNQNQPNETLSITFAQALIRFLDAQGIDEDVIKGVGNFDFSKTRRIAFIHTICGSHFGEGINRTGFPGLAQELKRLQLATSQETSLDIDCTASSIGDLDSAQMETWYRTFRGFSSILPTGPTKSKMAPGAGEKRRLVERFKIHFPSRDTVRQSRGGVQNGGTIFLRPKYWEKETFPREVFRDFRSQRAGLLSHCKIILARSVSCAWAYVGSANLSYSAWGRIVWDKTRKSPKMTAGNWECGVVVPVVSQGHGLSGGDDDDSSTDPKDSKIQHSASRARDAASRDVLPFDVFSKIIDVPFEWPASPYRKDQQPWCAGMDDTNDRP